MSESDIGRDLDFQAKSGEFWQDQEDWKTY